MDDELRWHLLRRRQIEQHIVSAFQGLRREGIEPILIKGWAAALNYPSDQPRFFADVDLAVSHEDYDRARAVTEDPTKGVLGVDLHCELRALDTLPWSELFSNSRLVELDGEKIRLLSPEDHLRVLCVHWLTNGGEERERLWDIYYAVRNRPSDFDWERCLNAAGPTRRGWIVATIGLANMYLGLEIDDLPFKDKARRIPAWLTTCVEREWQKNIRMRPLYTTLRDGAAFLQQIRKRIPPNPIQATVDCEGKFDDRSRFGYQFRDVFKRLLPSLGRVAGTLRRK